MRRYQSTFFPRYPCCPFAFHCFLFLLYIVPFYLGTEVLTVEMNWGKRVTQNQAELTFMQS